MNNKKDAAVRFIQEIQRKVGAYGDLAKRSTYNPKTKKYFAFSDSYVPDPGNYRQDLWSQVGFPEGPDTWDDLRKGGKAIKDKLGNPVGIGLVESLSHPGRNLTGFSDVLGSWKIAIDPSPVKSLLPLLLR